MSQNKRVSPASGCSWFIRSYPAEPPVDGHEKKASANPSIEARKVTCRQWGEQPKATPRHPRVPPEHVRCAQVTHKWDGWLCGKTGNSRPGWLPCSVCAGAFMPCNSTTSDFRALMHQKVAWLHQPRMGKVWSRRSIKMATVTGVGPLLHFHR